MDGIKLVFDIDDTICNNKNRDYENAIPFKDVIKKINKLHKQGAKITLYTSRGMVSCNGDIEKINKKRIIRNIMVPKPGPLSSLSYLRGSRYSPTAANASASVASSIPR